MAACTGETAAFEAPMPSFAWDILRCAGLWHRRHSCGDRWVLAVLPPGRCNGFCPLPAAWHPAGGLVRRPPSGVAAGAGVYRCATNGWFRLGVPRRRRRGLPPWKAGCGSTTLPSDEGRDSETARPRCLAGRCPRGFDSGPRTGGRFRAAPLGPSRKERCPFWEVLAAGREGSEPLGLTGRQERGHQRAESE